MQLLADPSKIPMSTESYEWLGHGFYFWENNYDRAYEWALDKQHRGKIKYPTVIGAVLDLMYCCDLLDKHFIDTVAAYFRSLQQDYALIGREVPANKDLDSDPHQDKLLRFRDCAAIQYMHNSLKKDYQNEVKDKSYSMIKLFESVRGVFPEGGAAFDGAGFKAKSHIQICIRNPNCIKGFFEPRKEIDFIARELATHS
jgi:hypothetical protein